MRHLPRKKKYLILTIFLSACSAAPAACHQWTPAEINNLKAQDEMLYAKYPDGYQELHGLIRNYETICRK